MVTPFQLVIETLRDFGFYDFFFPFIIMSAILYALLRKTKVLGDNPTTNGVLALSIAFLILGFPVLAGVSLGTEFSTFFTQSTIFILIFLVGIVMAGLFYPDMTKILTEQFKKPIMIYIMIPLGIVIFLTSGLVTVFTDVQNPVATGIPLERPIAPTEVFIIVGAIIIFIVLLFIVGTLFGGGKGG